MLKRKKNNQEDFAESSKNYVKEMVGGFAAGFMKNMTDNLVLKAKLELNKMYQAFQRNMMGMFLSMVGLAFILVGLAIFLNDLIGISNGFGYAIVGLVVLILGYITINKK